MGKKRLSRELKPADLPQDADESLPEAPAVQRRRPSSKPVAGGAEHRAGVEREEEPQPRGEAPVREDPPRGQKPSGG